MIRFPSVQEALELHRRLILRFGGSEGVRDAGLLESALFRPQTGYYEDLAQMAAAMMESLIINHPFVDGNKRMAFFLTDIFLRMNGWRLRVQPVPTRRFIVTIASERDERFREIDAWIRKHSRKLP